ncbi:MAG: ATP-dependent Lon protease, partial [SAR324 cluster bacterium]|nr:ATP-dependent Lon protease [SAR324 cluster bacterium]
IDLSYFDAKGKEIVVYCPESKDAQATQNPVRHTLSTSGEIPGEPGAAATTEPKETVAETPLKIVEEIPELKEKHFTIFYDDTGYSYESIIGPYLEKAKKIVIEEPYIRAPHQIQNFVRFCEAVIKQPSIKKIDLIAGFDDETQVKDLQNKLDELQQSLLDFDVVLDIKLKPNIHDREIKIDNGWVIKIGRGLDFYQKPISWFEVGVNDLSLRKCLETKVDIFRSK